MIVSIAGARRLGWPFCRRRGFQLCPLALAALCGCVDTRSPADPSDPPGGAGAVFGGEIDGGGAGGATGEAPSTGGGGRCSVVRPNGEARIDNFEDADTDPVSEPGRVGYWSGHGDTGEGSYTFEVTEGGADGTDFAARLAADGITGPVSIEVSMRVRTPAADCPYDASAFAGVGFFSKGTGRIELKVQTTDVFSTEFGGTCDDTVEQCWDAHRKVVPLTPEWTYREVRWDDLTQAGWGKSVPFDPAHWIGMSFWAASAESPVEVWVDEVRFLPGGVGGGGADGVDGGP